VDACWGAGQDRARERQRARTLLADAGIGLGGVITDVFGASGRAMLDALAAGHGDPQVLTRHLTCARRHARTAGPPVDELMQLYVLECFLARMAAAGSVRYADVITCISLGTLSWPVCAGRSA